MTVIPAINCPGIDCIVGMLHHLEKFLPPHGWVHLDVCDARFTFNRTWGDPHEWSKLSKHSALKDVQLEVHLMVEHPEEVITAWLEHGAKRIVIHAEAMNDKDFILAQCKSFGAEAMLALNPETPIEKLDPFLDQFSAFQMLAVNPGLSGQKFSPVVVEKIKLLRDKLPHATIEVDGGINLERAMLLKVAGADTVVSASYIFEAPDPGAAYQELMQL